METRGVVLCSYSRDPASLRNPSNKESSPEVLDARTV